MENAQVLSDSYVSDDDDEIDADNESCEIIDEETFHSQSFPAPVCDKIAESSEQYTLPEWDFQGYDVVDETEIRHSDASSPLLSSHTKQAKLDSFVVVKAVKKKTPSKGPVQSTILSYLSDKTVALKKRAAIEAKEEAEKFKRSEKTQNPSQGKRRKTWTRGSGFDDAFVQQPCPFYKKIKGSSFTVDAFSYGPIPGCQVYFLTHFHSDHYGGLNRRWSHGPIFCTASTARLVNLCLGVDWRWLRPVKMGSTIRLLGADVTFLPANHCPGSAIILFILPNQKTVVHTGDFRACTEMQAYPQLQNARVDTLYLDTTYCNPRYCFPLQEAVIQFVINTAKKCLFHNPKTLLVVGSYNVGKERIFLALAEALQMKICVEARRLRMLACLDWPELSQRLTTDVSSSSLHVLSLSALNPNKLRDYMAKHKNKWDAVLAFRPTGWTYSEKVGSDLHKIMPQKSGNDITIYGVPYSEHSSYSELQEFVQFLKPKCIIPTVNVGRATEREAMDRHFKKWLSYN